MNRVICIFSGTRAEYGILKPLMLKIKEESNLTLKIFVSGMHLSPEFGLTYKLIEEDNFNIDEKSEILLSMDTPTAILKSMGLGLIGFGEALTRISPDILIILGDRFEALSASISAMMLRIPVAHIHGGEATYGVVDESIRHSITKMSSIHFTSTEEYKKRVIQLGEHPDRVFNVGALGLDNIRLMKLKDKKTLESDLKFKFAERNLLVTFHPVTLEENTSQKQFRNLLNVLDSLKNTHIIFTKANADTYGRIINQMIDDYVINNKEKSIAFTSIGQLNYLSALQFVDAVVGNSSSGIIEAPSFKIGTINIGDRQKGRIKSGNVIDCKPDTESIKKAFKELYSHKFQERLKSVENPYGDGHSAGKIINVLKNFPLKNIIKKEFYDIKFDPDVS